MRKRKTSNGNRKISELELNLKLACWIRNNDKERIKLWNYFNKIDTYGQISTINKLEQIENLIQDRKMK